MRSLTPCCGKFGQVMTKILQLIQPSFSGISGGSATELLGIQLVLPCMSKDPVKTGPTPHEV